MKNKFSALIIMAVFCFLKTGNLEAAGLCCQLSSGVQESLAGVAAPGAGDSTIQITYSLSRMDRFKEGSTNRSLDEAKAYVKPDGTTYTSVPVSMDMIKYTMTAGYGFSTKLKTFVSVPYVRNTMDMTSFQGAMMGWMDMTMQPVSGVGDATAMVLYRLYEDRKIRPRDVLTAGIGVKAATGSFTEQTPGGRLVHAHMQPGTGSWDPLLSLLYTRMADQFLLQTDVTYQYTTSNRQGYEFGDSLAVNLTGKYAVVRQFDLGAGLTYLQVGRSSDRNGRYYDPATNSSLMDDPANTGGRSLWFSPMLQLLPLRDLALDAKVQLPLWEKVNGIQLVSRYRILIGLSYTF